MANLILSNRNVVRAIDRNLEAVHEICEQNKERASGNDRVSRMLADVKEAGLRRMSPRDREQFLNQQEKIKNLTQGHYTTIDKVHVRGDSGGEAFKDLTDLKGDRMKMTPMGASVDRREPLTEIQSLKVKGISGRESVKK